MRKLVASLALGTALVPALALALFDADLSYGDTGSEVVKLQEFLRDRGLFTYEITGNFFDITLAAVKAFQIQQSITPVSGYFGPITRAAANAILNGTAYTPPVANATVTAEIEALLERVRQLQAIIAQLTNSQTVTLMVNGQTSILLAAGDPFTVTWSSTNTASCTLSYTIGGALPVSSMVAPNVAGSSTGTMSGAQTTYTLNCVSANGSLSSKTVTIMPKPNLYSMFVTPTSGVVPLTVNATFQLGSSCSPYALTWGDGSNSSYSGPPGGLTCTAVVPPPFTTPHTYTSAGTFTVSFQTGSSATTTATVVVSGTSTAPSLPTVSLTVNGFQSVTLTPGTVFTAAWSSSNATSCNLTNSLGVTGTTTPNVSGSNTGAAPAVGQILTYSFSCANANGVSTKTAVVIGGTVASGAAPVITATDTNDPPQGGVVTITGTGFVPASNDVYFDSTKIATVGTLADVSKIQFVVPVNHTLGTTTMTVRNTNGTSNGMVMRVHAAGTGTSTPVITSKNTDDTYPGGIVQINGTGFLDVNEVLIDGVVVQTVGPINSGASLNLLIPMNYVTGNTNHWVTVRNTNGTSNASVLRVRQGILATVNCNTATTPCVSLDVNGYTKYYKKSGEGNVTVTWNSKNIVMDGYCWLTWSPYDAGDGNTSYWIYPNVMGSGPTGKPNATYTFTCQNLSATIQIVTP